MLWAWLWCDASPVAAVATARAEPRLVVMAEGSPSPQCLTPLLVSLSRWLGAAALRRLWGGGDVPLLYMMHSLFSAVCLLPDKDK